MITIHTLLIYNICVYKEFHKKRRKMPMNYEFTLDSLKIYIPYDYVMDQKTTGFDIAVYSYIYLITINKLYNKHHIHCNNISYTMFDRLYKIKDIQESLNNIYISKYFDIEKISNREYIINNESLQHMTKRFIIIPFVYIKKIVDSKKYELTKLLSVIIASRNLTIKNKQGVPYLTDSPQTYFAGVLNTSLVTVSNHTNALETLKIIYVVRRMKESNIIVLYQDKDLLGQYKTSGNIDSRILLQKYYWLSKGTEYSEEETEQIRNYIIAYNAKMDELAAKDPEGDYLAKKKDISIFNLT